MIEDRWTESGPSSSRSRAISPHGGDVTRTHKALRPEHPAAAADDSGGMTDVTLRADLARWFGFASRWERLLDHVIAALEEGSSLAISAPRGAAVELLATVLRRQARCVIVVGSETIEHVAAVRAAADRGPVAVIAEGLHADDILATAMIASGCAVARVPNIAERRDDLARLLGQARARAEASLGLGRANIRDDMKALYACEWAGHLGEIEQAVRMVAALRAGGSIRRAASTLGITKSTLWNQLRKMGLRP